MTTTFDPAATSPNITLSGGNLTATKTNATGFYASAFTSTDNATKMYFEARYTVARTDSGIGITNDDPIPDDTGWIGQDTGSIGLWATDVYYNGASIAAFSPAQGVNDWIGIAVDTTAQTIAFRNVTQGGAWSAPLSISTLGTAPLYFGATLATNDNTTANFDTAFIGAPPVGYTRWDGSPAVINYTMPAATRAFALTRNDAVLKRTWVMPAAKATLTLTGIANAMTRAVTLLAATRAFALTGIAAGLNKAGALSMTADRGVFTLTGNDAGLAKTTAYQMAADAGAFVLAGMDAALRSARKMLADAGALLLTGWPASLVYQPAVGGGFTLTAAPGAFALTGYAAALRVAVPVIDQPVTTGSLLTRTYIHSLLPTRRR